jgi:flagellar FliJ protein
MGESQRELDSALVRLDELSAYRNEYSARQVPGSSVSAARWHDYQAFLSRLDQAVSAQRQLILDAEQNVDAHRRRWIAKRQRRESLQRVLERYRREERIDVDRRLQQRLDDLPRAKDSYDD